MKVKFPEIKVGDVFWHMFNQDNFFTKLKKVEEDSALAYNDKGRLEKSPIHFYPFDVVHNSDPAPQKVKVTFGRVFQDVGYGHHISIRPIIQGQNYNFLGARNFDVSVLHRLILDPGLDNEMSVTFDIRQEVEVKNGKFIAKDKHGDPYEFSVTMIVPYDPNYPQEKDH